MGEEYRAVAYTVGVDVLAFSGTGSARDRIQACTPSVSSPVCGLGRTRGLPHFGDRLHRQDEVKWRHTTTEKSDWRLRRASTVYVKIDRSTRRQEPMALSAIALCFALLDDATRSMTRTQC